MPVHARSEGMHGIEVSPSSSAATTPLCGLVAVDPEQLFAAADVLGQGGGVRLSSGAYVEQVSSAVGSSLVGRSVSALGRTIVAAGSQLDADYMRVVVSLRQCARLYAEAERAVRAVPRACDAGGASSSRVERPVEFTQGWSLPVWAELIQQDVAVCESAAARVRSVDVGMWSGPAATWFARLCVVMGNRLQIAGAALYVAAGAVARHTDAPGSAACPAGAHEPTTDADRDLIALLDDARTAVAGLVSRAPRCPVQVRDGLTP